MKHFLLAALLVTFGLPNAVSFAQNEDEARAVRVQQQTARRNAAIERMIAPSTRAEARRHHPQQMPRVERPPRVDRGAQPRVVSPAPAAPIYNPSANTAEARPRRNWGEGGGAGGRDWRNQGRGGDNAGAGNRTPGNGNDGPVISPGTAGRGDGFRGRNWRNRDGSGNNTAGDWRNRGGDNTNTDWRNRTDGNRNWQNRGGGRNWNRGGDWSHRHRHWDRTRRDRSWWRSNYSQFVLFGGGYYYLHNNYWYPAYGYNPYFTSYTYDAPLYAYNGLAPQQVIAEVQAELQRQGYYRGGVDGSFGPMTRRALLEFQEDLGLPVSGVIDEDTLAALGFE